MLHFRALSIDRVDRLTSVLQQVGVIPKRSLLVKSSYVDGANNTAFVNDAAPILTGVKNGNTALSSFSPFSENSWSTYFDGTASYLTAPTNTAFLLGTGDFTIEAWIYFSALPAANRAFVTNAHAGTDNNYFTISLTSEGKIDTQIRDTTSALITAGNTVLSTNTWHHVAWVRSGNTFKVFLNGDTDVIYTSTKSITQRPIIIGAFLYTGFENYFNGHISNVRIIKNRSAYDVLAPKISVPTSPLISLPNTVLLTCQSNQFIDNSQIKSIITRTGPAGTSPEVLLFSPFSSYNTSENSNLNGSYYFDGVNDQLSIDANSAFDFSGSGKFTYEFWIYPTDIPATGACRLLMAGDNNMNSSFTLFQFSASGSIIVGIPASGNLSLAGPANSVQVNTWQHFAVSVSGTTGYLFKNGILIDTRTITRPGAFSSNTFKIGYDTSAGTSNQFKGYISNFRLVKGTSAPLYTVNFTPPAANLSVISGTTVLTFQSVFLQDSSSNNFKLNKTGDIAYSSFSPYAQQFTGSCFYFDGSGDYLRCDSALSTFTASTTSYTIECWAYPINTTSGFMFGINRASDGANILLIGNQVLNVGVDYAHATPARQWTHYAFVNEGGTGKYYINGVLVNTKTVMSTALSACVLGIGAEFDTANGGTPGNYFNGYISEIRITSGAVYTSNFTPSSTELTELSGTQLLLNRSLFKDMSSNNRTVTVYGGTKAVNSGRFTPSYKNSFSNNSDGMSIYFDGSGDYLNIAENSNFNLGSGGFTIEAWIYRSSSGVRGEIVSHFINNSESSWVLYVNSTNNLAWGEWSTTPVTGTTTLEANQWYHVAATRNGNTIRLFVNGKFETSAAVSRIYTAGTNGISIGSVKPTFTSATDFRGYISNLRIIKGTSLYDSAFIPPSSPLTAVSGTVLLACQDSTVKDNSTNNYSISSAGNSTPANFGPFTANSISGTYNLFQPDGSAYFDGSGDYLYIPSNGGFAPGTADFTIETWVNFSSTSGFQPICQNDQVGSSTNNKFYFALNSNQLAMGVHSPGGAYIAAAWRPNVNTWYHVAVVRHAGIIKFFVDGRQKTITTGTQNSMSSVNFGQNGLAIGAMSTPYYLNGYLSNFRYVVGAAVYTVEFQPPSAVLPIVSGTQILTLQSAGFKDNSTNNASITVNGDVKMTSISPFSLNALSKSVYFDGVTDHLIAPAIKFASNDFTVECWINTPAATGGGVTNDRVIFGGFFSPNTPCLFFLTNGGNAPALWNGTTQSTSSLTIAANTWTHVAWVRKNNVLSIYVNGKVGLTVSNYNTNFSASGQNYIGKSDGDNTRYFKGYISNLRVSNGTAFYTSDFTPSTSPLTPITGTSLLTCQTSNISDSSANNMTIQLNGNANAADFSPFTQIAKSTYGGSMYFDGSADNVLINYNSALHLNGDFTIETWFYPLAYGGMILNFAGGLNIAWASYELVNNSDGINFAASSANTSYDIGSETGATGRIGTVQLGSWNHLAITRSGNVYRGFVNGVQGYTQTLALTPYNPNARGLAIGSNYATAWGTTPTNTINGYLSNLRIVTGTALYTANFTPPTSALAAVAGTSLLLSQSDIPFYDKNRIYPIESVGNAKTSRTVSKFTDGSIYFDGNSDYLYSPANSDFAVATGDFTIETWVNFSSFATQQPICQSDSIGSSSNDKFYFNYRRDISALVLGQHSSANMIGAAWLPSTGTWYHIAVVRRSGVVAFYVNGQSLSITNGNASLFSSTSFGQNGLSIGAMSTPYYLNGYLSNFRFSPATALYSSNFTPPSAQF